MVYRAGIKKLLEEDLGTGDITTELVVNGDVQAVGKVAAKEQCIVAGIQEAMELAMLRNLELTAFIKEGQLAEAGKVILELRGSAKEILIVERLLLNLMSRMCSIATLTRELVDLCRPVNPNVEIMATRKTTPGFRYYEKRAVEVGGGKAHRFALYDAVLIKDNHIQITGLQQAVTRAKKSSMPIEVEVEDLEQARTALEAGADIIMLDNFSPADAKEAYDELKSTDPNIIIEVSGGITPKNIKDYAGAADRISLGWLTHSIQSKDLSLELVHLEGDRA